MTTETETRAVEYMTMAAPDRRVAVRVDHGETDGLQDVPYLTWARRDDPEGDGGLSLILDDRFLLMLSARLTHDEEDEIVAFVANAIAIGGGYPSIYYLDRKMPFR